MGARKYILALNCLYLHWSEVPREMDVYTHYTKLKVERSRTCFYVEGSTGRVSDKENGYEERSPYAWLVFLFSRAPLGHIRTISTQTRCHPRNRARVVGTRWGIFPSISRKFCWRPPTNDFATGIRRRGSISRIPRTSPTGKEEKLNKLL